MLDDDGTVDFSRVQQSFVFQQGVERIELGLMKNHRIALMCSEGDPLDCHRLGMVAAYFAADMDVEVAHILRDGTLRAHADIETDLMKKYEKKLPVPDLFNPNIDDADRLRAAYRLQNKDIGWRPEPRTRGYDPG